MSEKKVVINSDLTGKAADQYGSDDEIMGLAARIESLHPKAKLLGSDGCIYVAQLAMATGAKVLPEEAGEIVIWEDKVTREAVIILGFEYHNRIASESGGYIPLKPPREMTASEENANKMIDGDIGATCQIIRREDLTLFLGVGGITMTQIVNDGLMCFTGMAVVRLEEMIKDNPPKGRTWLTVAKRRATKDALTQAFGKSASATSVYRINVATPAKETDETVAELNDQLFG